MNTSTIPKWKSWKYKIFVCEEDNLKGFEIAKSIKAELLKSGYLRVSVEELPKWENAKNSVRYIFPGAEIRAEENEIKAALYIKSLLQRNFPDIELKVRKIQPFKATPGYISFFICPKTNYGPEPGVVPGVIVE